MTYLAEDEVRRDLLLNVPGDTANWTTVNLTELPSMNGAQCRAARAILSWSQRHLAKVSGVGLSAIISFEHGRGRCVSQEAVAELRGTLEEAGLDFISESEGKFGVLFHDRSGAARPDEIA
ncbi:helix-turn-helix domain-containing protein [Methylobacterium soli]|uniref:helix-turn-helix domain-containing protein n=1 Tax=Methylobacterium soli TaxID=553447 RepID=UPI00177EE5AD|nr:helix-turn-helix domain-containing protein [Methylobacterium soli]GJE46427.1 hypothetical protein AEGHOMDF_5631 [Methylobacterium soli]